MRSFDILKFINNSSKEVVKFGIFFYSAQFGAGSEYNPFEFVFCFVNAGHFNFKRKLSLFNEPIKVSTCLGRNVDVFNDILLDLIIAFLRNFVNLDDLGHLFLGKFIDPLDLFSALHKDFGDIYKGIFCVNFDFFVNDSHSLFLSLSDKGVSDHFLGGSNLLDLCQLNFFGFLRKPFKAFMNLLEHGGSDLFGGVVDRG